MTVAVYAGMSDVGCWRLSGFGFGLGARRWTGLYLTILFDSPYHSSPASLARVSQVRVEVGEELLHLHYISLRTV